MGAGIGDCGEGEEIRARIEADELAASGIPSETDIAQSGVEEDLGIGFLALVGGPNGAESHRFNDPSSNSCWLHHADRRRHGCRWGRGKRDGRRLLKGRNLAGRR